MKKFYLQFTRIIQSQRLTLCPPELSQKAEHVFEVWGFPPEICVRAKQQVRCLAYSIVKQACFHDNVIRCAQQIASTRNGLLCTTVSDDTNSHHFRERNLAIAHLLIYF